MSIDQRDKNLIEAKWTYFAGDGDASSSEDEEQWGQEYIVRLEDESTGNHDREANTVANELMSPSKDSGKTKYRLSKNEPPVSFLSPVDRARLAMENKGKIKMMRSGRKSSIMLSLSTHGAEHGDDTESTGDDFNDSFSKSSET